MNSTKLYFSALLALLIFSDILSANTPPQATTESSTSSVQQLETSLHEKLEGAFDHDKLRDSKNDSVRQLAKAYTNNDFEPFWIENNSLNEATHNILQTLKNADQEGLNPEDYKDAIQVIEQKNLNDLFQTETVITKAVLAYIDDLAGERLNPRRVHKELFIRAKEIEADEVLTAEFKKDPTMAWLVQRTVPHKDYQFLKKTLSNLRAQKDGADFPTLSAGMKLEKGSKGERVIVLQKQLQHLKYLKAGFEAGVVDDTTDQAIRQFQEDNRLKVDGIVGPNTLAALNGHNLEDRIRQVIVSMERWRWLPQVLPERYVFVNIAGFDLKAVENGETKLHMPVIIGKRYRTTPVFNSEIYSIRFNPSWHVPRSIAVRDKLRKIQRDPGYLSRGGYVLYDASGSRISPNSVNWSSVSAGNWNYRLRQVPGNHNALGKIRFTIKNRFNIYLHDTNQPELFKKTNRSMSSGCIRVSEPEKLGAFVFNGQDNFGLEEVTKRMQGTHTENIPLENPVPVFINYLTVWEDPQTGEARFGQDIYGQDKAIWNALQN